MSIIRDISIKNKLLLVTLIPLVALFYFLSVDVADGIRSRERVQQVYDDVLKAEAISDVLHQIQQERGYSLGYILSEGTEEKDELFRQREQTDKAIFELRKLLTRQDTGITTAQNKLNKLPDLRGRINTRSANPDSVRDALGDINTALIDEISKTALYSKSPEVKNHLNAHLFLLYGKEYFGQLRASLKQALLRGSFDENGFAEFAALKGRHEISLESFKKNASDDIAEFYNNQSETQPILKVQQIMNAVYNTPSLSQLQYTEDEWWINGVAYLNTLKEVEAYSALAIRQTAENQLQEIYGALLKNIVVAVITLLLITLLLYYTISYIVSSILQIKDAADRISQGNLDLQLSMDSKDEIGSLASSFNKLIQVSREYAEAADVIGHGDYSPVVRVRGESDVLGASLLNMKNNLQELSFQNEKRNWLLTGNSELNDLMHGEQEIQELAQEVVKKITTYLNGQIGAIYLSENGHLRLVGSYAFNYHKDIIKYGEGLIGQAALEKKPIVLRQVPNDYIKVNSALGNTSPKNIIVYPFLFDEEVKGVIEVGTTSEFSKYDMEFLDTVAENIGIAFNSMQSRTMLKELLEETQRQAEKLEAQQEELRQTNEELQEKTNLLEESEAELKAQQEELQQTNEELEEQANLLEEQKNSLEVAKMEIETKAKELEITNKYKSEFLANMSHELRTPLNSILILSQLLGENKTKALGPKEVEFAKNIYSSGTDLLNLINEILDLSKVESGKIELEIDIVDLNEISSNLQATFREVAINRGVNFDLHLREESIVQPFATDKQRLEQILRNLLSNAFKFTDKRGTVTLDIYSVKPPSMLRNNKLHTLPEVISFAVSDTGVGIPENKQAVIFEAFQQADGSTKRKYGGTGLGLSISRELANALGGEILLESEAGKGSTFTLYLPYTFDANLSEHSEKEIAVKPKPERILTPYVEPQDYMQQQENVTDDRYAIKENDKVILIVEDDDQFADILLNFVREKGYRGILAHQGNIALSLARHHSPDAIILDMKLPVMDGAEVLRHLKNDPELRHIPVQVISGYDRRNEGFELGAFDFIKKPITQNELDASFGRIEEFINRKLKRLLVVEDNKQQNMAIRELVSNSDVKSFSAYTGEEAYKMLQKEKFDCVIIDLGLPDMGGMDLLEKIKANEDFYKVPIIVYTGKELTKEETSKLHKLANTVVLKTVDSTERLLDETVLFLHSVESKLPKEKQQILRKLHRTDEVLHNKKILIVDDDMRNIYSLTNALEEEGVRCITAENGKEAIRMLQEQPDTDIVLMDVMMPEMDGYETTREIRKMSKFSKLPVIALTAKAMKGDREKCLEAGMSDYVPKPVNIEQLLSLMRVWLYK
ncbi:response regulator [Pontibacter cellulosilyticus]|uniref:histidine kinase n=1 Tax=Pontibacter cellulosilyticus TaxID=1720253 RepID=A0A923SK89_9BACT|nr:response regulator [Pontibacter cellulosilyticus]MBC5993536.1 response regulator [Pontibacter cellulosilyticus]